MKTVLAFRKILRLLNSECFFNADYCYIFNRDLRNVDGSIKINIKIGDLDGTNCLSFLLNDPKRLIGVHVSKKTKGKAKEERAGSCVSAWLVFGDVKCVTFLSRAAGGYFSVSCLNQGDAL